MKYFICLSLVIVSTFVKAEPYVFDDGSYRFTAKTVDECYGKGRYSHDCKQYFDNRSEDKLNSIYDNLLSKIVRDKELLVKSQEKWNVYAKAQCSFESAAAKAYANPEKQSQLFYDECMNTLKEKRSEYLKNIMVGCSGCVK